MSTRGKSRYAVDGRTIPVCRGVVVFKIKASPYYRVRVWLPAERKRVTRSTKATTRIDAIKAADEFRADLAARGDLRALPKQRTFEHYADKLIQRDRMRAERGELKSLRAWRDTQSILRNPNRGLLFKFGKMDITKITTKDYISYMDWTAANHSKLAPATRNRTAVVFQKVMRLALEEGIINALPETPRSGHRDNPRAFFRFHPLVPKEDDEYMRLLATVSRMAEEGVVVRGVPITNEMYDLIGFLNDSFLRPTESELFALKHTDVNVVKNEISVPGLGIYLTLSVNGKTGHRSVVTQPGAVFPYTRAKKRATYADDYVFFPGYENRATAKKIAQRQFKAILKEADLLDDGVTKSQRSLYSLRHTAICKRLVRSKGQVNIFTLAKNAGTSVDQIERFYARNLPLSADMIKNLQSYGD